MANQRIIDAPKSRQTGKIILWDENKFLGGGDSNEVIPTNGSDQASHVQKVRTKTRKSVSAWPVRLGLFPMWR